MSTLFLLVASPLTLAAPPAVASVEPMIVERTTARVEDEPDQVWAAHYVYHGAKRVPIIGRIKFQTSTYLIADVRVRDGMYALTQRTCRTEMSRVIGARVELNPNALDHMPPAKIRFVERGGVHHADEWPTGWGSEDLDLDGHPGVTVTVRAPLCSGDLYVESRAASTAVGTMDAELHLRGQTRAYVDQRNLGASRRCLEFVSSDQADWMEGTFAYTEVPRGSRCEDLLALREWPVRISESPE